MAWLRCLQVQYSQLGELPFEYTFHDDSIGSPLYVSIQCNHTWHTVLITFPENYPFAAPHINFLDILDHPDVDSQGNACVSDLVGWVNLRQILLHIYCLLEEASSMIPPTLSTQPLPLCLDTNSNPGVIANSYEWISDTAKTIHEKAVATSSHGVTTYNRPADVLMSLQQRDSSDV
jgi:hypothetical protein